mgnify:CR=1 FL=1
MCGQCVEAQQLGFFCGGVERCIGAVERLFISAAEWIFFSVEWFYNEYR